jgi:hypothetical protein
MVWKKGDPVRRIQRWTLKSVGRSSLLRKMMSASGELKMGSEEGDEDIMAVWGFNVQRSKIVIGYGGQGPLLYISLKPVARSSRNEYTRRIECRTHRKL